MFVRVKMLEFDKDLLLLKLICFLFFFIVIFWIFVIRFIRFEWLNMDVYLDLEICFVVLVLKILLDKCLG